MSEYLELVSEIVNNVLNFLGLWPRKLPLTQSLEGKIIVITGANRSSGKEAAILCASLGAQVILACRNIKLAQAVEKEIIDAGHPPPITIRLDLCSLQSIAEAAREINEKVPRVDAIIHNAGMISRQMKMTDDHIETTVQANYVGQVLLTEKLLQMVNRSSDGRIIFVSSLLHHSAWKDGKVDIKDFFEPKNFSPRVAYAQSKAASLMYCRRLCKTQANIKCYSVDPGIFSSDIVRDVPWWMNLLRQYNVARPILRSPGEALQSIIAPLFLSSYDANNFYYGDGQVKAFSAIISNDEICDSIYRATIALLSEHLPSQDNNKNNLFSNHS